MDQLIALSGLAITWCISTIFLYRRYCDLASRIEEIENWPECHADSEIEKMKTALSKFQEMQLKFDLLMEDLEKEAVKIGPKAAILFSSDKDSKEKMVAAVKNSPHVRVVIEPEAERWIVRDKE